MKITDVNIDKLSPCMIANDLRDLYNKLEEIDFLKRVYMDKEKALTEYKKLVEKYFAETKKCDNFSDPMVLMFIKSVENYREISRSDAEIKLIDAEYLEKVTNFTYNGFIDKEFWGGTDLLEIAEYLENGKAKTLAKAIELFKNNRA